MHILTMRLDDGTAEEKLAEICRECAEKLIISYSRQGKIYCVSATAQISSYKQYGMVPDEGNYKVSGANSTDIFAIYRTVNDKETAQKIVTIHQKIQELIADNQLSVDPSRGYLYLYTKKAENSLQNGFQLDPASSMTTKAGDVLKNHMGDLEQAMSYDGVLVKFTMKQEYNRAFNSVTIYKEGEHFAITSKPETVQEGNDTKRRVITLGGKKERGNYFSIVLSHGGNGAPAIYFLAMVKRVDIIRQPLKKAADYEALM